MTAPPGKANEMTQDLSRYQNNLLLSFSIMGAHQELHQVLRLIVERRNALLLQVRSQAMWHHMRRKLSLLRLLLLLLAYTEHLALHLPMRHLLRAEPAPYSPTPT